MYPKADGWYGQDDTGFEQRLTSAPWIQGGNPGSGAYLQSSQGCPINGGSYTPVNGSQIWLPFDIGPTSTSTQSINFNVATAGTLGAASNPQFRLGIYNDDGTGAYPTTVLDDAGIVTTITAGGKTASSSHTLNPGRYWLSMKFTVTGTMTTIPILAAFQNAYGGAGPLIGTMYYGWYQTGLSAGALATMSGASENTLLPPNIGFRQA